MVETESGAKDYTINSKESISLAVGRSALELLRIYREWWLLATHPFRPCLCREAHAWTIST